jgi:hypothetical protein
LQRLAEPELVWQERRGEHEGVDHDRQNRVPRIEAARA